MDMCLLHVFMSVCVGILNVYVHACVWVYRLPTHSAQTHVCVFACRGQRLILGTSLGHSPLYYYFFQMRTLTEPVVLNSVNDLRDPRVSVLHHISVGDCRHALLCSALTWHWGSSSSCLHGKHFTNEDFVPPQKSYYTTKSHIKLCTRVLGNCSKHTGGHSCSCPTLHYHASCQSSCLEPLLFQPLSLWQRPRVFDICGWWCQFR